MTVNPNYIYAANITGAYFTYDFVIQYWFVRGTTALDKLTLGHHIVGLAGIYLGAPSGYSSTGMTNVILMTEMSTFFLNYREMQENKASSEPLHVANQLVFFATFTFVRMILSPYVYVLYLRSIYYLLPLVPLWRKFGFFMGFLNMTLLILLNSYWYTLIVKGLLKLLGCMKSRSKKTDEDKKEK